MKKILATILIVLAGFTGYLQFQIGQLKSPSFRATIPTVVALFETSLASNVSGCSSAAASSTPRASWRTRPAWAR